MNKNITLTSPVAEKVRVHEASLNISADMKLASMDVTVSGQYNIHSNCFYPSQVTYEAASGEDRTVDLETFCQMMDWEESATYEEIQEAVEKRDQ